MLPAYSWELGDENATQIVYIGSWEQAFIAINLTNVVLNRTQNFNRSLGFILGLTILAQHKHSKQNKKCHDLSFRSNLIFTEKCLNLWLILLRHEVVISFKLGVNAVSSTLCGIVGLCSIVPTTSLVPVTHCWMWSTNSTINQYYHNGIYNALQPFVSRKESSDACLKELSITPGYSNNASLSPPEITHAISDLKTQLKLMESNIKTIMSTITQKRKVCSM